MSGLILELRPLYNTQGPCLNNDAGSIEHGGPMQAARALQLVLIGNTLPDAGHSVNPRGESRPPPKLNNDARFQRARGPNASRALQLVLIGSPVPGMLVTVNPRGESRPSPLDQRRRFQRARGLNASRALQLMQPSEGTCMSRQRAREPQGPTAQLRSEAGHHGCTQSASKPTRYAKESLAAKSESSQCRRSPPQFFLPSMPPMPVSSQCRHPVGSRKPRAPTRSLKVLCRLNVRRCRSDPPPSRMLPPYYAS